MTKRRPPHTPPSGPDDDGVRVVAKPPAPRPLQAWVLVVLIVVFAGGVAWMLLPEERSGQDKDDGPAQVGDGWDAAAGVPSTAQPKREAARTASQGEPTPMPNRDPDDLANYFQPGDPEPTGAEVIQGLQAAGVRTGLGAFNPPGTSPPLEGLAVPADFPLPDGYVRHHQVTDEGVPIEPILMFAPEFTLHDANGRPIAMPANRVVPPELAPPGLPLRWVRIGKP